MYFIIEFSDGIVQLSLIEFLEWKIKKINDADLFSQLHLLIFTNVSVYLFFSYTQKHVCSDQSIKSCALSLQL